MLGENLKIEKRFRAYIVGNCLRDISEYYIQRLENYSSIVQMNVIEVQKKKKKNFASG